MQPERTTMPNGGDFWTQLLVLRNLLYGLPQGWKIYVKEHPRQFTRTIVKFSMARCIEYYQSIIKDPCVQLIPHEYNSTPLLKSSRCVATITGTVGWEAAQKGKPVLCFGQAWYRNCPGVYPIREPEECQNILAKIDR